MHAPVAAVDQRVSQSADDAVVQRALQPLQLGENFLIQPALLYPLPQNLVPLLQRCEAFIVGGLGEHPHSRPLDDGPELVGELRELKSGLHELDYRARLDRKDTFGLENPEGVAQGRDRYSRQPHQLILRHERTGRETTVEK